MCIYNRLPKFTPRLKYLLIVVLTALVIISSVAGGFFSSKLSDISKENIGLRYDFLKVRSVHSDWVGKNDLARFTDDVWISRQAYRDYLQLKKIFDPNFSLDVRGKGFDKHVEERIQSRQDYLTNIDIELIDFTGIYLYDTQVKVEQLDKQESELIKFINWSQDASIVFVVLLAVIQLKEPRNKSHIHKPRGYILHD